MQRCLQAWMPLPRARLQAAAILNNNLRSRDTISLSRQRYCRLSTTAASVHHDDSNHNLDTLATVQVSKPTKTVSAEPVLPASEATQYNVSRRPSDHRSGTASNRAWSKMVERVRHNFEKELGSTSKATSASSVSDLPLWIRQYLVDDEMRVSWSRAAIWLLENDRMRAIDFLVNTHGHFTVPGAWTGDIVSLLALYCSKQETHVARPALVKLVDAIDMISKRKGEPLTLAGGCVHVLLPQLTNDEVKQIYSHLEADTIGTDCIGFCHFSRYFASRGDLAEAIGALIGALNQRVPMNSFISGTLQGIIACLVRQPDGYLQSFRLCENLQAYGIELDTTMANMLLRNAVQSHEYQKALDLYGMLFSKNRRPDARSMGLLLKMYNSNPDSETGVKLSFIVDQALEHDVVGQSEIIANQLLHAVATHEVQRPETAWDRLCRLYSRVFRGKALESLDMPLGQGLDSTSAGRQPPTKEAIGTMVYSYLKIHLQGYLQESDPVDVYKNFRSLVFKGEQPFLDLATSDYIYNHFLYSFVQTKETLINATEVMKDMQTPLPSSLGVEGTKPSSYSWNIFLMGFQNHNKPELANQVLQYMKSEGIERDQVTWNVLINGPAMNQNLDGLLQVLQEAEGANAQFDEYTEKGIRRFRNQDGLLTALRAQRPPALDFSDELRAGLAKRLEHSDPAQQDRERGKVND